MTDLSAIRILYDTEFRMQLKAPEGTQMENIGDVIRLVGTNPHREFNKIIYSKLDEHNADKIIADQVAFFTNLGHDFEWTVFEGDQPHNISERLSALGFVIGETETILVLDTAAMLRRPSGPTGVRVEQVSHERQLADVIAVQSEVWRGNQEWLLDIFRPALTEDVPRSIIFIAYDGTTPVGCAWIRFEEGKSFASLNGGTILPAYRGKGIYKAFLSLRAEQARQRGVRYLTVDAGPMSLPILLHLGFVQVATATPFYKLVSPN